MARKHSKWHGAVSWERARAIFGNPDPPAQVWESQFDYNDDDLKRLAATPYQEIHRDDLWYYFHDLAYVDLQPDLFRYLFPVCLMEWHDTLMRGESCAKGDSEFHKGIRQGRIFEKMLTPLQRQGVVEFFRDSFLLRVDKEPVSVQPSITVHPFGWICRFNSLARVLPRIDLIWEPWWKVETRGRAVAVLKYCSGLIYFEGENKPFGIYVEDHGWLGPHLWENDSYIYDHGWLESNIEFVRKTLTFDYVLQKSKEAAGRLWNEPEHEQAQTVVTDAVTNRELVESRIAELPQFLAEGEGRNIEGWSV